MSALEDVQHALNAIRLISSEENANTQARILELILQTSISQLKSMAEQPKTNQKRNHKSFPTPSPMDSSPAQQINQASPKPKAEPSWAEKRDQLRPIQPIRPDR
jgi:hypothetical protein